MENMRILGIDPGLHLMGFGVLDVTAGGGLIHVDCGVVTTSKHKPESARLQELFEDLTEVVKHFKPDCMSVERIFFFKNAKTLVPISQARGVILLVAEMAGVAIAEYTPMQAKQALTGYGKADKKEIQDMVKQLLDLETIPKPDDAADGLALAICHAHFMRHAPVLATH